VDGPAWLAERLADLDRGDIAGLVAAARTVALPDAKSAEVEKALSYFETNSERMRYARLPRTRSVRGLGGHRGRVSGRCGPEAQVVSGMRWNVRGASAIVNLRCEEASGRWEQIWARVNTQTTVA
jgi:hypothetical protein